MGSEIVSLYKIADVLQMPFEYDGKTVTGKRTVDWPSGLGFDIPMTMEATAIYFSEQVGLICHLVGDLYILVSHDQEKKGLSAYLIDSDKVLRPPELWCTKDSTLRSVVEYLSPAIVQSFYNTSGKWKAFSLPN